MLDGKTERLIHECLVFSPAMLVNLLRLELTKQVRVSWRDKWELGRHRAMET